MLLAGPGAAFRALSAVASPASSHWCLAAAVSRAGRARPGALGSGALADECWLPFHTVGGVLFLLQKL